MARIDVDERVSQPGYHADLVQFRRLRSDIAPLFAEFFRLKDPIHREAWLAKDVLMSEMVDFCRKVEGEKNVS